MPPSLLRALSLGHLFGIPILVTPLAMILTLWIVFQALALGGAVAAGELIGILLLLIMALLAHELGHALMARHFGLRVIDITIRPLGGAARIEGMTTQPKVEGLVAVAGPVVNLFFLAVFAFFPGRIGEVGMWIHGTLALGNLIPAFPLDGGRILRSWLSRRASLADATRAAIALSNLFLLVLLAVSIRYHFFLIALILCGYLAWSARMELMQVILRTGQVPHQSPEDVWKQAFQNKPSGDAGVDVPSEKEQRSQESPEDLENFHGSMEEYFRQKKSWGRK